MTEKRQRMAKISAFSQVHWPIRCQALNFFASLDFAHFVMRPIHLGIGGVNVIRPVFLPVFCNIQAIIHSKSKLGMKMMTKFSSDWDMKDTDRDVKNCTKWRNPRGIRWCCGSNGKNLFLPSLSRESPTCFKQTMNLLHWNKLRFFLKENTEPNQQEDKFD